MLTAACNTAPGNPEPVERAQYALRGVRTLDVATGRYSPPSVVLIRQGRISRIIDLARFRAEQADSVLALDGAYVVPGLIDAHVHLGIGGPPRQAALADVRAGFTTVVDLGARTHRILRIRDSINSGAIPGPRVLAAGIWTGIQNGVCEFNGIGLAGNADAFRGRVRENVDSGADVVKLCLSGWPADAFARPESREVGDDILSASMTEARALRRLVVAHAISRASVDAALRAGVNGLAHTAYLDSALAARMRAQGMFMVTTIASLAGDSSAASRGLVGALQLAHRLGVTMVMGTDGGVLPHGQNAQELLALQAAGIPAIDVLRTATINAARAFQLSDSVGRVAPGMSADMVVVDRDPIMDLTSLTHPRLVIARGILFKP